MCSLLLETVKRVWVGKTGVYALSVCCLYCGKVNLIIWIFMEGESVALQWRSFHRKSLVSTKPICLHSTWDKTLHNFSPFNTNCQWTFFRISVVGCKIRETIQYVSSLLQGLSPEAIYISLLCHLSSVTGCFIALWAILAHHNIAVVLCCIFKDFLCLC